MTSHFIASFYSQFFSSGTTSETTDGILTITSSPSRYVMWSIAFLVLCPLSLWCWRRRFGGNIAPSVFFASFVVPLLIIPAIATDSIRVAPDSITIRTGLWFAPTNRHISLAELDSVIETDEAVAQRGAPRREIFWTFHYRSAPPYRVDLPDLLDANRDHVIRYLRTHGFHFRHA